MCSDIRAIGLYTGSLRHLALRVKDGKRSAIERAADILASNLPVGAMVIPMPSHEGRATTMLEVARAIVRRRGDMVVVDALECVPHGGNYNAKKRGHSLPTISMSCRLCSHGDIVLLRKSLGKAYIIDNCVDTGATFAAASRAIPGVRLLALASTHFPETSQSAV